MQSEYDALLKELNQVQKEKQDIENEKLLVNQTIEQLREELASINKQMQLESFSNEELQQQITIFKADLNKARFIN